MRASGLDSPSSTMSAARAPGRGAVATTPRGARTAAAAATATPKFRARRKACPRCARHRTPARGHPAVHLQEIHHAADDVRGAAEQVGARSPSKSSGIAAAASRMNCGIQRAGVGPCSRAASASVRVSSRYCSSSPRKNRRGG